MDSELPPWVQQIATLIVLGASLYAAWKGAFGKLAAEVTRPKEIAVPGVTLADNEVIKSLTAEIHDMNRSRNLLNDRLGELQHQLQRLNDQVEIIKHTVIAEQQIIADQAEKQGPR